MFGFLANQTLDLRAPERQRIASIQNIKNYVGFLEDGLEVRIFGVQQYWGILVVGCSGLYGPLRASNRRGSHGSLCIILSFGSGKLGGLLLLFSLLLGFSCLSPLLSYFSQDLVLVWEIRGDPRVLGLFCTKIAGFSTRPSRC